MEYVGIDEYINTKRSPSTKSTVKSALYGFIRFITKCNKGCENLESLSWLASNPEYYFKLREYSIYLNEQCLKNNYSPLSVHNHLNNIINWLKWNEIFIPDKELSILQNILPRKVLVHEETELTREIIHSILSHSDIQMKALILLLCSSGMRINEALSIEFDEIKEGNPSEVRIPRQRRKAGIAHTYFISKEAYQAIIEYLKVRDNYQKRGKISSKNMNREFKNNSLFGLTSVSAGERLRNIQIKAGIYEYDEGAKRAKITFHSFRKWMESNSKLHQPSNIVNAIIGHDEGLDKHYRRYSLEQMREAYKVIEPHLFIEAPSDYAQLQGETKQALIDTNGAIVNLAMQLSEQKKSLEQLKNERDDFYNKALDYCIFYLSMDEETRKREIEKQNKLLLGDSLTLSSDNKELVNEFYNKLDNLRDSAKKLLTKDFGEEEEEEEYYFEDSQ